MAAGPARAQVQAPDPEADRVLEAAQDLVVQALAGQEPEQGEELPSLQASG